MSVSHSRPPALEARPWPTRTVRSLLLISLTVLTVLTAPATATVFVMPDDDALVAGASSVVLGTVSGVDPFAGATKGSGVFTDVAITGVETLTGRPVAPDATVRMPGGIDAEGRGLAIHGLRPPAAGDRLVLFIEPAIDGTYRLHELMLGMFAVEQANGRAVAHRPLHGARLMPAARSGRVADAPRDLEAWRAWLRDRELGVDRPKDYFVATAPEVAGKFRLAASSALPAPLGCGDDGGRPVRWTAFDAGEATRFARGGTPIDGLDAGGAIAFGDALATWSAGDDSSVALVDGGTTLATGGLLSPDGTSAMLTGDPNDTIPGRFEGVGLLALGGAWLDCQRVETWGDTEVHPVIEADIVTQDGIESFFAASADPEAAASELFAHELGHALGFAHSDDPEALMYGIIRDDGRGGRLADDDLAARAFLYPRLGLPASAERPTTPTAFVALLAEDHVALAWRLDPRTGAVRIERSVGEAGLFRLLAVVGNAESYFDRDLLPGTEYRYRLTAFNQGGSSVPTDPVAVTTDGTIAPTAASNLRTAPRTATSVRLSWQDNADDELFYRVESRIDGVWETVPPTLPANTTEVVIDGLEHGLTYRFRVRAVGVLAPSSPSNQAVAMTLPPTAVCNQRDRELCLLSGRFAVTVRFRDPRRANAIELAQAVSETDNTGRFWFFRDTNTELIVKMINGESANGFAWVFYGGLSDLEYWIDIIDTETGRERTYHNPLGALCGASDTQAFPIADPTAGTPDPPTVPAPTIPAPTIPAPTIPPPTIPLRALALDGGPTAPEARNSSNGGPCVADDETLCLLDGRFAVRVDFRNQHNSGMAGVGKAIDGGDQTGFFYFFNLRNTELVVKILDGRTVNEHFWVFFGGLSDVEYTLTVRDTETGAVETFLNQPGEVCGGKDTRLFFELPPTERPRGDGPLPR